MDGEGERMKRALLPIVLVAATALLYLPRLGQVPLYMAPDEIVVAVNAKSIATTGRDLFHGRFLPLYVEFNRLVVNHFGDRGYRDSWLTGMIFYADAIALKVLPFSEASARVPTVAVGLLDVLLVFLIGRRIFQSDWVAALAAALLALTPAHLIHSRLVADYIYPLPFLLAWLLWLLAYFDTKRERTLFISVFFLGIGLYSYAASMLVMPLYFLITLAALWHERRPLRAYVVALAAFALPALICVPWVMTHPGMVLDVLNKYNLNSAGNLTLTPLQSLRSVLTYHRIGDQVGFYFGFFNPRFLFFDGSMEMMFSTREVGVFLLPVAALLVAGLVAAARASASTPALLLVLGLLAAPIAATTVNVGDAIYRALEMLPFAALLAAWGARLLWDTVSRRPNRLCFIGAGIALLGFGAVYARHVIVAQGRTPGAAVPIVLLGIVLVVLGLAANRMRMGQIVALALLAAIPIQFATFYVDYLTDYPRRSAVTFSGNIRGAYEEALRQIDTEPTPVVYLGEIGSYSYGGLYWRFYLMKHGREALLGRTHDLGLFYPGHVEALPAGSLIVTNAGDGSLDAMIDRMIAAGRLKRTAVIREPDGAPSFEILRRIGS